MSGRSKQDKVKSERRSVPMSEPEPTDEPPWERPPADELRESDDYTIFPEGLDVTKHRVKMRMVHRAQDDALVEFAVVQQYMYKGKWRDVAVLDSCHDKDVHLHYYGRSTLNRVGKRQVIKPLTSLDDVLGGFSAGYALMAERWSANWEKWHDA